MAHHLTGELALDSADLLAALDARGIRPVASQYEPQSFGNYFIEFGGRRTFKMVRDRGQYFLQGPPRTELEEFDLWRAYDDRDSFRHAVLLWLSASGT